MNSFARALKKVNVKESIVERNNDRRKENESHEIDKEFREIMFDNSPKTKEDWIQGEKGRWIE